MADKFSMRDTISAQHVVIYANLCRLFFNIFCILNVIVSNTKQKYVCIVAEPNEKKNQFAGCRMMNFAAFLYSAKCTIQ